MIYMQSRHRSHLWATLKTIDEMLQRHETWFANDNNARHILSLIHAIRNDIHGFLHEFGFEEERRDILWELLTSCSYIEVCLIDLEPARFQQAYGKFDSLDEVRRLEVLATLREKITELETVAKSEAYKG